jgi:hypothetical protein
LSVDQAPGCDAVVATLLYHFGNEKGIEDCAQAVRRFYQRVGFTPLRGFGLRSWQDDAALLLVRTVESG